MLELWRKMTAKFPAYRFGFNGDNGVEMQISVMSIKTNTFAREVLDYGLSPKQYAVAWLEMLEAFGEQLVHDTTDV